MKKIEMIWREILEETSKNHVFQQNLLAKKYGFSTSTVFAALKPLRGIGAIEVTGRNFRVINREKILLFWATHRELKKEIIYQTFVNLPVLEIEGLMPQEVIYGAYAAARRHLRRAAPADYDKVYVYADDFSKIKHRFPPNSHFSPNLFVLRADPFLFRLGSITPVSQTYADLWNLSDWFAQDYFQALKEQFYVL